MKKIVLVALLLLLVAGMATAQTRFFRSDSTLVSTANRDTSFSVERYETAHIMFVGCNGYVMLAMTSVDTLGWAHHQIGKRYIFVPEYSVVNITPDAGLGIPGLYRMQFHAASGSGIMYLWGTKKVAE